MRPLRNRRRSASVPVDERRRRHEARRVDGDALGGQDLDEGVDAEGSARGSTRSAAAGGWWSRGRRSVPPSHPAASRAPRPSESRSCAVRASSSTNSGLPSARATMASTWWGRSGAASVASVRSARSDASSSGRQGDRPASRRPRTRPRCRGGATSSNQGRRSVAAASRSSRCADAASAHWASSTRSSSGPLMVERRTVPTTSATTSGRNRGSMASLSGSAGRRGASRRRGAGAAGRSEGSSDGHPLGEARHRVGAVASRRPRAACATGRGRGRRRC